MSLAYEKRLGPAAPVDGKQPRLNIDVVFTSVQTTLAALKRAGELASRLDARITPVVPQIVQFPAPLESPPVLIDFNERRLRVLAGGSPAEIKVQIYLCRDRWDALQQVLRRRSPVVVGGRTHWWPTDEQRLARKLRRHGYEVIFAETE